jgi:carboxypeptidase Taq
MANEAWREVERRMAELRDFSGVIGLLSWDQETYMPPGGAEGRAQHLAAMQALVHERLADPRLGELLDEAEGQAPDEWAKAALRNLRRERDRAVKIPGELVRELAERQSRAVGAWRGARGESRFERFRPHLERLVELKRQQADALGHDGERYDALLEMYEPGMRVARLQPIFERLETELAPIVRAITEAPPPAGRWELAGKTFPVDGQWDFTVKLLGEMGFDLARGRQDKSVHPFTGGTGSSDVRLTTKLLPDNPFPAIFGTIHEGGHGLYEQGLPREHERDFAGVAASMGLHESQSRLWENLIGRSRAFWERYLPELQRHLPATADATPDSFFAAVNRVERSPIRIEADEVTYNLHILLRFRLELAMLRGDLAVADLPGAWNEGMEKGLGIRPENDALGVLQDIHWAWAEFGYFPTYTLGNLYAATLHAKMDADLDVAATIRRGELTRLRDWLGAKVHRVGHLYDAEEIVERATGQGLSVEPFLAHVRGKYGPLYGVSL